MKYANRFLVLVTTCILWFFLVTGCSAPLTGESDTGLETELPTAPGPDEPTPTQPDPVPAIVKLVARQAAVVTSQITVDASVTTLGYDLPIGPDEAVAASLSKMVITPQAFESVVPEVPLTFVQQLVNTCVNYSKNPTELDWKIEEKIVCSKLPSGELNIRGSFVIPTVELDETDEEYGTVHLVFGGTLIFNLTLTPSGDAKFHFALVGAGSNLMVELSFDEGKFPMQLWGFQTSGSVAQTGEILVDVQSVNFRMEGREYACSLSDEKVWDCLYVEPCTPDIEAFAACEDGVDNDCDGLVDMKDPDCSPTSEICDDGIDNDGDGFPDCFDVSCENASNCAGTREICNNRKDDDLNGLADCSDDDDDAGGCKQFPACDESTYGSDACVDAVYVYYVYEWGITEEKIPIDNDSDGLPNCMDPDCDGHPACVENCNTYGDEDGDGFADCQDSDCLGQPGCSGVEVCNNGIDDNGNDLVDCADLECAGYAPCVEGAFWRGCADLNLNGTFDCCEDGDKPGGDNDGDGLVDCQETETCHYQPWCMEATWHIPDGVPVDVNPKNGRADYCEDGIDNDGDMDGVDCADATQSQMTMDGPGDCAYQKGCTEPSLVEDDCMDAEGNAKDLNNNTIPDCCEDGKNNDYLEFVDYWMDCEDPDCSKLCKEDRVIGCIDENGDPLDEQGRSPTGVLTEGADGTADCCQDLLNNDGDMMGMDCSDSDCNQYPPCNEATACDGEPKECCSNFDGFHTPIDDDGDYKANCDDPDCQAYDFCNEALACDAAEPEICCSDRIDNDNDGGEWGGKTDCDDPDCKMLNLDACNESRACDGDPTTCCSNKDASENPIDDDGDGMANCSDYDDCGHLLICNEAMSEDVDPENGLPDTCEDGEDNDTDGLTDCADFDCGHFLLCKENGKLDCNPTGSEKDSPCCGDGQDNDGDGPQDCDDPDCSQDARCSCGNDICQEEEPYFETDENCHDDCHCGNGICEDGGDPFIPYMGESDTLCFIDCHCGNSICDEGFESDMPGSPDYCEQDCTETQCADWWDNDGDGLMDCDDPDCADDSMCTCGNGECVGEDVYMCPQDCEGTCGDGYCNSFFGETKDSCNVDCGWCGDGICGSGEESWCTSDCPTGPVCGDLTCSSPSENALKCPTDCTASCGDDLCSHLETILSCPADCAPPPGCGDGNCEGQDGERADNCPIDCAGQFGDGVCNLYFEYYYSQDCQCGNYSCDFPAENAELCSTDCFDGDGTCAYPEETAPLFVDCHCGNMTCEFPDENAAGCPQDCFCGNRVCESPDENSTSCSTDCWCGNGVCEVAEENNASCSGDCWCGDGICHPNDESAATCPGDCPPPNCGDASCKPDEGENNYNCPGDCNCGDGLCYPFDEATWSCPTDCYYPNGTCDQGENSTDHPDDCYCGNGTCEFMDENSLNCHEDCHCGYGGCEVALGENSQNCSMDCNCGDGLCDSAEDLDSCYTDCTPEVCDDGNDNDDDGSIDCDDVECYGQLGATGMPCPACGDGTCEQWPYYESPEPGRFYCEADCTETNLECYDGLDNDGDYQYDCSDSDCYGAIPPAEYVGDACASCGDGICTDWPFYEYQEEPWGKDCQLDCGERICDDGQDNDGDGDIDCVDPDCQYNMSCY